MRSMVLVVVAVLFVACHTSIYVRTGDDAYKRGDYAEALKNYEIEQRYRPSDDVAEKIARTKAKMVEKELEPIEVAFREKRFDDGVTGLLQLDAEQLKQPAVQAFVKKQETRLREELGVRAGQKQWGAAFVLAKRAARVFPALADKVPEYARSWTEALRPAIADASKQNNEGGVVLLRAALAVASGDASEASQAKQALEALRRKYALAIEVRGKGDTSRVQSALGSDPRFALSGADAKRGRVTITLGAPTDKTTTTRGREMAQVQKGTRTAENPDHQQAEANVQDKEEALAHWKEQKADEMNSPTRTKESIEGYDYPIEVAQGELDDARENLRNTPATIQEPNMVDVPFDVETTTLTVARDVTVEIDASWKGDLASQRENVKLAKSDKSHAANAEAGIGRDPVELPSPASLGPELDGAVVQWLDGALNKVAGQYHRSLLVGMTQNMGLPLAVALSPGSAHAQHVKELAKVFGVPMGAQLLDALATDHLATAFDEPLPTKSTKPGKPTKAIATTKPTPVDNTRPVATPTPSAKPTPTPAPTPTPTAPADPMLAKAGYALTIAPFAFKRGSQVVIEVDRDGTMRSGKLTIGALRANGTLEDSRGKIVLAIDKSGSLWMPRQNQPAGKITSTSLAFEAGATLTFDGAGHVRMKNARTTQVSEAVLAPNTPALRPAAMIVAWLGVGKLAMRAEK